MGNLCTFYKSTIGKKFVVATTGVVLFLFVVGHVVGNLKAFQGFDASGVHLLDIYGHHLREMGAEIFGHGGFLWIVRIVLLGCLLLHVFTVLQLRAVNAKARPVAYRHTSYSAATAASRSMLVGGIIILAFVVFHIFQLTVGCILEGFEEGAVYANIHRAFSIPWVVAVYGVAMAALGFHLYHGIWSLTQTLGLDNPDYNKQIRLAASLGSVLIALGFISVPLAIFFGVLSKPAGM